MVRGNPCTTRASARASPNALPRRWTRATGDASFVVRVPASADPEQNLMLACSNPRRARPVALQTVATTRVCGICWRLLCPREGGNLPFEGEFLRQNGQVERRDHLAMQFRAMSMSKAISADRIRLKTAYEAPAPDDGTRILIDRLWPRGVKKADAAIDECMKEIAPSTNLRKWFGHDPGR
jgi:Protein of unknown function, DUF488